MTGAAAATDTASPTTPAGPAAAADASPPPAPAPVPARPIPPATPPEAARRAPDGPQETPPKTDGSWLQRFLRPGSAPQGAPGPEKAEKPASESAADTPSAPPETPETPASPWAPPASREEEERRVQAEVDRRAARAQKQQAQQTRAQQRAVLEQQEREARQTDVYKAAEMREQLDAMAAQEQFVAGLVGAYDQSTLDPLVSALPEPERAALLQDAPTGMEGRKALVEKAVSAIKAQGAREAEAKLRKSTAFRKQVLADWRRGVHGDEDTPDEPELVNGTNGHRAGPSMNDWLRAAAR